MNPNYQPSFVVGRIGYEQARETIRSIPPGQPATDVVAFLESCIREARKDLPVFVAELIYQSMISGLEDERTIKELESAATQSDSTGFPHRFRDLISSDYMELLERWRTDPAGAPSSDTQQMRLLESELTTYFVAIDSLRQDPAYAEAYEKQFERHLEFGMGNEWSRDLAQRLQDACMHARALEQNQHANSQDVSTAWSDCRILHVLLLGIFAEHQVPVDKFMNMEEAQFFTDSFLNLSGFTITANMIRHMPKSDVIKTIINSGACNVQSNTYVHEIQLEIDRLVEIQVAQSIAMRTSLTRDQFAVWLFNSLRDASIAPFASLEEIKEICNVGRGTLRLKIRSGDVWCAQILVHLSAKLGISQTKIKVLNGDKKLEHSHMMRALARKRSLRENTAVTRLLSSMDKLGVIGNKVEND